MNASLTVYLCSDEAGGKGNATCPGGDEQDRYKDAIGYFYDGGWRSRRPVIVLAPSVLLL